MNVVYLLGNLGRDPDIRTTRSGTTVAEFIMATNETWTDSDGQRQESTTWHDVVAWADTAESLAHLRKGSRVLVEGRLIRQRVRRAPPLHGAPEPQVVKWSDPTAEDKVKVRASKVTFL